MNRAKQVLPGLAKRSLSSVNITGAAAVTSSSIRLRQNLVTTPLNFASPCNPALCARSSIRRMCTNAKASDVQDQLAKMVKSDKVFLFMKGTPAQPMCGFSNAVTQILRMHGVQYSSCNVLENENIREGVKKFSDWPTIPQLYVNGEFVGGCDILIDMHQKGDLVKTLNKAGIKSALEDKEKEGS